MNWLSLLLVSPAILAAVVNSSYVVDICSVTKTWTQLCTVYVLSFEGCNFCCFDNKN